MLLFGFHDCVRYKTCSPWATRIPPERIHQMPLSGLNNRFNRYALLLRPPRVLIDWLQKGSLQHAARRLAAGTDTLYKFRRWRHNNEPIKFQPTAAVTQFETLAIITASRVKIAELLKPSVTKSLRPFETSTLLKDGALQQFKHQPPSSVVHFLPDTPLGPIPSNSTEPVIKPLVLPLTAIAPSTVLEAIVTYYLNAIGDSWNMHYIK